jgi:transcriptional regulator with XRE-family HTH domain
LQGIPLRLKTLKPKDYAENPQTLGEHIRKRRTQLGFTQRRAAEQIGVDVFTVLNWEKERTEPRTIDGNRVIAFLGYDPFPPPGTLSQRLVHERRKRGWSIERAAGAVGVDASTWQRWERGELILRRKHRFAIARLLDIDAEQLTERMRAKWNARHGSK